MRSSPASRTSAPTPRSTNIGRRTARWTSRGTPRWPVLPTRWSTNATGSGIGLQDGICGFSHGRPAIGWPSGERCSTWPSNPPNPPLQLTGEGAHMEYVVRLEQLSGRPLAVVRRRAASHELSKVVPDACGIVWNVLRSQQVSGAGRHVALYLDAQINLEVGVELDGTFIGYGEVVPSAVPSGLVATTTHYGPYGQLHQAHDAIRRWCRQNAYSFAGPELGGLWSLEGRMEQRPE